MASKDFSAGKFVISLDFELMWGVRDKRTIENYGENILGVQKVIPSLLALFDKYGIRATFSTVGFLFARDKEELIRFSPAEKPAYSNKDLSPYLALPSIGNNENDDPYHFGFRLLQMIRDNGNHEIGTHTYCHYYCLEDGQTLEQFTQDLQAANAIAKDKNISVRSIVFPRNQFNEDYLEACKANGIESFRGNPLSWLYEPRRKNDDTRSRRAMRLIDTYWNITGHHCYTKSYVNSFVPYNIPGSRFLRPYSEKTKALDGLKLRRIKSSMRHAARTNKLYHLWWHPHNFGKNTPENLSFLEEILKYYQELKKKYGFQSQTMCSLADELKQEVSHG